MRLTTLTLALFPMTVFAAGGETDMPPTPSEKTTECAEGQVWDKATQSCMDPDNLLARSYMGQGHVASGEMVLAQAQLTEIRMRGGRNTWAEASLVQAITTGSGTSY